MALTKREKKERPKVERIVETSRVNNEDNVASTEQNKKEWTAKDRRTIKIDPDIKSLIEIFSDFDGTKEYDRCLRKVISARK